MNPLLLPVLTWVGLLGLAIGSFLNVVVHRVPAAIPLARESRCPRCDAPVRWWQNIPVASWFALRGRCRACRAPISVRYPLVETATAVVFVGVAAFLVLMRPAVDQPWGATVAVTAAYLWFAAASIALTLIDLVTFRLPDAIVLPSGLAGAALLLAACLLGADWSSLLRAVIAAVALFLFYLLLRLVRPDAMGGGDVKLAAVVGLHLGWLGWDAVTVGGFAAFVLGGVFGLALILLRRAGRRTAIPFGPWMLAGAWTGIVFGAPLADWYLGLAMP